jgi:hypothetical protein
MAGMPDHRLALDDGFAASTPTREDRDEEEHQEYHEEYLGNPSSSARDAAESQDARNEGDHEKDDGIVKHGFMGFGVFGSGDSLGKGTRRMGGRLGACKMEAEGGGLELLNEAADVFLGFPGALLDAADHFFLFSFLKEKIVVRKLGVLLFDLALEGVPPAFEREFSHGFMGLVLVCSGLENSMKGTRMNRTSRVGSV